MTITKRQWVYLIAIGVAALVLVMQAMSLYQEWYPSSHAVIKKVAKVRQSVPASHPISTVTTAVVLPPLSARQQRYLHLVDDIQLMHIQRQLLQAQAEVAAQRTQLQQASVRHQGGTESRSQRITTSDRLSQRFAHYRLRFLAHQNNQWQAMLSEHGHEQWLHGPLQLSNGDRVLQLSAAGVLMGRGTVRWLVTMGGVESLPSAVMMTANRTPKVPPSSSDRMLPQPRQSRS